MQDALRRCGVLDIWTAAIPGGRRAGCSSLFPAPFCLLDLHWQLRFSQRFVAEPIFDGAAASAGQLHLHLLEGMTLYSSTPSIEETQVQNSDMWRREEIEMHDRFGSDRRS